MKDAGSALMGIGYASGENRAARPPSGRCGRPLIDTEITGAAASCSRSPAATTSRSSRSTRPPRWSAQRATDDTNIIFGATIDDRLTGQVWITVVATGLGGPAGAPVDVRGLGDRDDRSTRPRSCATSSPTEAASAVGSRR